MTLVAQAQEILRQWREVRDAPRTFLMINPAPLHGSGLLVAPLEDCIGESLVDQSLVVQPEVKPFLLDLSEPGANDVLKWWCEQTDKASNVSLLASRRSTAVLAGLLRQRLDVVLQPNTRLALRPYDTRAARAIFDVLTPSQRATLLEGIEAWAYADRDGVLRSLPSVDADVVPTQLPIVLDTLQVDALVQASHTDRVMPRLSAAAAAVHAKGGSAEQAFASVRTVIERAQRLGLDGLPNWIAFCEAWSRLGADFDERSPWRERLLDVSPGKLSLLDALKDDA